MIFLSERSRLCHRIFPVLPQSHYKHPRNFLVIHLLCVFGKDILPIFSDKDQVEYYCQEHADVVGAENLLEWGHRLLTCGGNWVAKLCETGTRKLSDKLEPVYKLQEFSSFRQRRTSRHNKEVKVVFYFLYATLLWIPLLSQAGTPYFETGFGLSQIRKGSAFFETTVSGNPSWETSTNISIFENFTSDTSMVQFHFGVKSSLFMSKTNLYSFSLLALYPAFRLEFSHIYIGLGISPLLFKRFASTWGILPLQSRPNALGCHAETGVLWKVVPFFFLAIEGEAAFFSTANSYSPAPALSLTLQFRFHFWSLRDQGGGSHSTFDGWRYPFGIEIF